MERKTLFALATLLLSLGAVITDGSLLNLQKMIKDVTGKNAIINYGAYGCHCGVGGKGKILDHTDWCCHKHDCCYNQMVRKGCSPRTAGYSYTYQSGDVSCGSGTSCQQQICECDRELALCLERNSGSYRTRYRFYLNRLCRGQYPSC
uniref:phospholipase A2, membrane associated-like n=1 Tax=Euleptes europaea TaxID=460621 RepID=UPI00254035EC|nr:phospholipase A2, membrane associated-like [Euleptes europaea]